MRSWIEVPENHDFPIQNLPYCIFSVEHGTPRAGVAIGDYILDLSILYVAGHVGRGIIDSNDFAKPYLNDFMAVGREGWLAVRNELIDLLQEDAPLLRDDAELRERALVRQADATLHLPVKIGDYVDFYSSEQHATNVGKMLRPENPLMPNWKHLPVGYNGRASSVIVSGTAVRRPHGQTLPADAQTPVYGPSRNLDFELEVGFITGRENPLGAQISTDDAEDHIFGLVLVNDWSARDIQKWEYQPLGPFLAKSFATSISPWIVTLEALREFRVPGPVQEPPVFPYLQCNADWAIDMHLEVALQSEAMSKPQTISRTNFRQMYWNMAQQLAHQGVNGTNVQVGDLYASGTVSGDTPDSYGSMLELAWRGERPISIEETGEERRFLQDGDKIIMTGWCQGAGYRVGLGSVEALVLPASN